MKRTLALATFLSCILYPAPFLLAQGALTPPGAPAATMKTLDQVEARKPIGPATSTVTISAPGSYYLAGDITSAGVGIMISSGNVTLDLNGFSVRNSTATNLGGISIFGPSDQSGHNITIRNGHISGPFGNGIEFSRAHNVIIEDIAITGAQSNGILCGSTTLQPNSVTIRRCRLLGAPVDAVANAPLSGMSTAAIEGRYGMACLIEDCVVANIVGDGIRLLTATAGDATSSGVIRGCVISRCGGDGIDLGTNATVPKGLLVERCTIDQCGADGMNVASPVRVIGCVSKSNTGDGFQFSAQAFISGCLAEGNGDNGIQVTGDRCHLTENTCASNTAAGIRLTSTANACRIDSNHATAGARAFFIEGTDNLIVRNSAQGATVANYDIVAGNHDAARVPSPGANFASTSPWVNFSF